MDYIEKYRSLKTYMALCLSPYGNDLLQKFPWINSDLEKIQLMLEQTIIDNKESNNPEIVEAKKRLNELLSFRKLVPLNSLETINTVDSKISEITSELSENSSYDAETYYDVYFLQLGVTTKDNASYANLNIHNTKSIAFNNWFSNSKVVDSNGNPMPVYHGTSSGDFSRFKFDIFPGMYFAENKTYSEWFRTAKGTDGIMFECYLKILNPIDLRLFKTNKIKYNDFIVYMKLRYGYELPENTMLRTQSEIRNGLWAWKYLRNGADWLKFIIKDKKFDGITFYENNPDDILPNGEENTTPAWMVFNSNQIKSSNSNILFSENSQDIRFKKGGQL
jgi:hypothetical protein